MRTAGSFNSLRIASPCPVGWEQMSGDEQVRHCSLCDLNVYNISEMTPREVKALIATSEGRICARLYRRADGTVITRDCPVGLRAIRRRVAKTAGAVFAAIVTLCATVAGQKPAKSDKGYCMQQVKITKTVSDSNAGGTISLQILDVSGAVVSKADVVITKSKDQTKDSQPEIEPALRQTSNDRGRVEFAGLTKGLYDIRIESPGFGTFELMKMDLGVKELIALDVTLMPAKESVTVGIMMAEPALIDQPSGMTIISGDLVRKLPY